MIIFFIYDLKKDLSLKKPQKGTSLESLGPVNIPSPLQLYGNIGKYSNVTKNRNRHTHSDGHIQTLKHSHHSHVAGLPGRDFFCSSFVFLLFCL